MSSSYCSCISGKIIIYKSYTIFSKDSVFWRIFREFQKSNSNYTCKTLKINCSKIFEIHTISGWLRHGLQVAASGGWRVHVSLGAKLKMKLLNLNICNYREATKGSQFNTLFPGQKYPSYASGSRTAGEGAWGKGRRGLEKKCVKRLIPSLLLPRASHQRQSHGL